MAPPMSTLRLGVPPSATDAVTPSRPAAARMHAAVRIEPSVGMTPRAKAISMPGAGGVARRWAVPFRGQRKTNATKIRREAVALRFDLYGRFLVTARGLLRRPADLLSSKSRRRSKN